MEKKSQTSDSQVMQNFGMFLEVFENGNKLRLFKIGPQAAELISSLGGITTERLKFVSSRTSWRKTDLASESKLTGGGITKHNKFWVNPSYELSETTEI